MLACFCTLIGFDDERGPQLFRIDPAGQFFSYHAIATGSRDNDAMNYFERIVDDLSGYNTDQMVQAAIRCLQRVLSTESKPEELEIAFIDESGHFRSLSVEEVDAHLTTVSEAET